MHAIPTMPCHTYVPIYCCCTFSLPSFYEHCMQWMRAYTFTNILTNTKLCTCIQSVCVYTVFMYTHCPCIHCVRIYTVFTYRHYSGIHCIHVSTVYMYTLYSRIHCVHVYTVYTRIEYRDWCIILHFAISVHESKAWSKRLLVVSTICLIVLHWHTPSRCNGRMYLGR